MNQQQTSANMHEIKFISGGKMFLLRQVDTTAFIHYSGVTVMVKMDGANTATPKRPAGLEYSGAEIVMYQGITPPKAGE